MKAEAEANRKAAIAEANREATVAAAEAEKERLARELSAEKDKIAAVKSQNFELAANYRDKEIVAGMGQIE